MKTSDENKSAQPTPEQLLKLLDAQMNASRQQRAERESGRRTIQVVSIAVIAIGAAVALWVLMFMLEDMRPAKQGGRPVPADGGVSAEDTR